MEDAAQSEFERGVQHGIALATRESRAFVDGWREGARAAFISIGKPLDENFMLFERANRPKYGWEEV